jgi:glycosyltransferase involved in cell wall biosynthesis
MKIVIVAQNASSRFGGESFLPLKYFELLRKRGGHEVNLIVHGRNRADLSALFPDASTAIHYVEDTALHLALWRLSPRVPKVIGDAVFGTLLNLFDEIRQRRLIKRLIRAGGVDVIHQPIPVSPKAPSAIFGFGVPVVIGPMNGGMSYPPGYEDHQGRSSRRFVAVARLAAVFINRLIPGKHLAATLLVANERTRKALPVTGHPRVLQLVENAVDHSVWHYTPRPREAGNKTFRLVYLGRMVKWKAIDITLDAIRIAREKGHEVELLLIGDGEDRPALQQLAGQLALDGAVRFAGFLSQAQCASELKSADALILNSVYECGGAVVLEAMSLGLPIIAADWGGPADYVDASCGILVSPAPRQTFAQRLAEAIGQLAADPAQRIRLGEAGRQRVRSEFDWENKIDQMLDIYAQAQTQAPQTRPLVRW